MNFLAKRKNLRRRLRKHLGRGRDAGLLVADAQLPAHSQEKLQFEMLPVVLEVAKLLDVGGLLGRHG